MSAYPFIIYLKPFSHIYSVPCVSLATQMSPNQMRLLQIRKQPQRQNQKPKIEERKLKQLPKIGTKMQKKGNVLKKHIETIRK